MWRWETATSGRDKARERLRTSPLPLGGEGQAGQSKGPPGTPQRVRGARGVDTRRAALTPGGGPGPGPRQGPALRGGSQGRVTGAENKAPPLGKAG